jgi:hypothetical protein
LNELAEVSVLTQTFNAEYAGHGGAGGQPDFEFFSPDFIGPFCGLAEALIRAWGWLAFGPEMELGPRPGDFGGLYGRFFWGKISNAEWPKRRAGEIGGWGMVL